MNNTIGCLSICLLMVILIVSKFQLFQIKLLWTFTCKSSYDSLFFFFLGKCLEMEWLAHTNCQSFPKWLYRVILLSAVYRSPTSSISSLKLGLVIFKNILGLVVCMYWGLTVVIICILLMILSIFARTYVPIMYLFAHFKSELFILLLMTF